MTRNHNTLKRILAALLCMSLLTASVITLAEESVANVTDSEGPKLYDFKMTKSSKNPLKPGAKVSLSVKARDRSGISSVVVSYYHEDDADPRECSLIYDAAQDLFLGEIAIGEYMPSGEYHILDITAYDQYGNRSYYYTWGNSNAFGRFKVKAKKADKLKATVKVKEKGKTLTPKNKVHVTVKLKTPKEASRISVELKNQKSDDRSILIDCSYNATTKKYEGHTALGYKDEDGKRQPYYFDGTYELNEVSAYDASGNKIATATFDGQSVTLRDGKNPYDVIPPLIVYGKIEENGKTLKAGKTVHFSAYVKDNSELGEVNAYLYQQDGKWSIDKESEIAKSDQPSDISISLKYRKKSGTYEGKFKLPKDFVNGKYYLAITASDIYDNVSTRFYDWQTFTFTDKDRVTEGIRKFVRTAVETITGTAATETQIEEYGLPLAEGKANAVQTIRKIVKASGLTGEAKVRKLCVLMKGAEPSAEELANLMKLGDKELIDTLADNTVFRALVDSSQIIMGSFSGKNDGVEIGTTAVEKVKLNKKKATLKTGKEFTLKATLTPDDATYTEVEWTSSDPSIATVNKKGVVEAISAGTCVITCTAKDGSGKKATCKITVKDKNAKNDLKLSEEKLKLEAGETAKLKLADEDAEVRWSSSDESVAKVNSKGKVTAIGKGKCTITCEAADGSAKIEIPVKVK